MQLIKTNNLISRSCKK